MVRTPLIFTAVLAGTIAAGMATSQGLRAHDTPKAPALNQQWNRECGLRDSILFAMAVARTNLASESAEEWFSHGLDPFQTLAWRRVLN